MLRIAIAKQSGGTGVLHCTRQDGSVTWQKQNRHAAHFALHDLTHYAVESILKARRGFFGLIAEGWEVDETTGKGARGALPAEALEIERIVGLFDSERASQALWTPEQFNEFAPRALTGEQIDSIRRLRAALFERWAAIPQGEKLQLQWPATG